MMVASTIVPLPTRTRVAQVSVDLGEQPLGQLMASTPAKVKDRGLVRNDSGSVRTPATGAS